MMENEVSAVKMLNLYRRVQEKYDRVLRPYAKKQMEEQLAGLRPLEQDMRGHFCGRDTKITDALIPLQEDLHGLWQQINALTEPFKLFVIGTGNAGKSTVVNTLVGQPVAATDFLPRTWRLDVFRRSEDAKTAVIHYANGEVKRLPLKEAAELIAQADEKAEELQERLDREVMRLRRDRDVSHQDMVRRKQELFARYESDEAISRVDWPVQGSSFMERFDLVDTPGMDQVLYSAQIRKDAEAYYEKANGIIWVIPVDALFDKDTYEQVQTVAEVFSRKQEQTIAVLNKFDSLPTQAEKDLVMEEARKMYGAYFTKIVPYSGEETWQQIRRGERADGQRVLQEIIRDQFFEQAQMIKLQDLEEALQTAKIAVGHRLTDVQAEMKEKYEKMMELEVVWREYMRQEAEAVRHNLESLVTRYIGVLRRSAEAKEAAMDSIKSEEQLNDYIRNEVFDDEYIQRELKTFEDDWLQHINYQLCQFLQKYWKLSGRSGLVKQSLPALVLETSEYERQWPIKQRPQLTISVFGGFSRFFGFWKFSTQVMEFYEPRLYEVQKNYLQAMEKVLHTCMDGLVKTGCNFFAETYFPIDHYARLTDVLCRYKETVARVQVRTPGIIELIKEN